MVAGHSSILGLYIPEWDALNIASTVLGLSFAGSAVATETKPTPTPYSKFGKGPIPSRLAMFIIYVPSTIAACWFLLSSRGEENDRFPLVATVSLVHFAKRVFEVAFVHIYRSTTDLQTTLSISLAYLSTTALNLAVIRRLPQSAFSSRAAAVGLGCVATGEILNGYHHWLLRRLRVREKNEQDYVLPRGGLFNHCVAPHYFAEQVIFFGIMILSQNLVSVALNLFPMVYLTLRAARTHEWYANHLPASEQIGLQRRKRLIPFIW